MHSLCLVVVEKYFHISSFILIFRCDSTHNHSMKTLREMSSTPPPGRAKGLRIRQIAETHWLEIVKARQLEWPWPDIAEALGLPRDAAGPLCTAAFRLRRLIVEKRRKPAASRSNKINASSPSPSQPPGDPQSVEEI